MGRRSGSVRVDVDISDVLDEIDTKTLREELRERSKSGDNDAVNHPALAGEFTEHDLADIAYFVEHGQAHELLSLMASCMAANPLPSVQRLHALQRDADTGRPVIQ